MLAHRPDGLAFSYNPAYLDMPGVVSLGPSMPLLRNTWFDPLPNIGMPGPIRDAAPDAWGRRVLQHSAGNTEHEFSEGYYLLHSGSNRLGAIDFQASPREYVPRGTSGSLTQLLASAETVEAGEALSPDLDSALLGGTSIGGARPKATLSDEDGVEWLAKFSSTTDTMDVIGNEAASNYLARVSGIATPDTRLETVLGKKVILTRRFDRTSEGGRINITSGLTILGLDASMMPQGSYPELLDVLNKYSPPGGDPINRELFMRVAFNMAISNTDDHLRNHAAFWDGKYLRLTPAYDLTPGLRSGETASHALAFNRAGNRESSLAALVDSAREYGIAPKEARELCLKVITAIEENWGDAADFGELTAVEREQRRFRQYLNPGSVRGVKPKSVSVGFTAAQQPRRPKGSPEGGEYTGHTHSDPEEPLR